MKNKKVERKAIIISTEDKLNHNNIAEILARYITKGDPLNYLKNLSQREQSI